MNKFSIKDVLKKNVMAIALFVIYVFFTIMTGGNMFSSSNVTSLIEQNAYVFILGVGMLMCMLTGGNMEATRLSGIDTKKVMFSAYTLMGLLSGFAGILNIARLMGSQPTYGLGYEMDAIAACFIGGASAYGGTGTIGGVIIGAALCGIINQGMVIANTPPNYQTVVKGIVLLVAVLFDVVMQLLRKVIKKKAGSNEKGGANA